MFTAGAACQKLEQNGQPFRAEGLDDVIAATCARVMRWRKEKVKETSLGARRALQDVQRERAAVSERKASLAETLQLADAAQEIVEGSTRVSQGVLATKEASSRRAQVAAELLKHRRSELEARSEELRAAEAALADDRLAAHARQGEIDSFFATYKDRLGLSISRSASSVVRVAFSLLDEDDPTRECSFKLGLADTNAYSVCDCCPSLPPKQVASLLKALNASPTAPSALPAFCVGIRKAFKEVASRRALRGGA
jgi:hypothetical protein